MAETEAREHLKKAAAEIEAYEKETCCEVNRRAVDPLRQELALHYRADELTEAVARKQISRTRSAEAVVKEGLEAARKEGVAPPSAPFGPAPPAQRGKPGLGIMPFRPGAVVRESVSMFRDSVRIMPRPGRLLRGEFDLEERKR